MGVLSARRGSPGTPCHCLRLYQDRRGGDDAGLGDGVHAGGGLVEHDELDVAQQQPGEGDELLLAGGGLLLVTAGALGPDPSWSGQVLTLFVITIAAAEVVVALAVIVAAYRRRGHIDLAEDAE